MPLLRTGAYAFVLLLILSGLGIAWGAQTVVSRTAENGEVVVDWERMTIDGSDIVRVWIRNAGDDRLEGSPQVLILNENGGVRQSFAFGQFVLTLDPDESVYVDWTLGTVQRCHYGMMDANGAPSDMRYPCAEPMDGPTDDVASDCYDCYHPLPSFGGRFIVVGVFGEHADAAVVDLD
jgi:hypothetical protein